MSLRKSFYRVTYDLDSTNSNYGSCRQKMLDELKKIANGGKLAKIGDSSYGFASVESFGIIYNIVKSTTNGIDGFIVIEERDPQGSYYYECIAVRPDAEGWLANFYR